MADNLIFEDLRGQIGSPEFVEGNALQILSTLGTAIADEELETEARELVIRLLENRRSLNGLSPVLDALVRQVGLFPYIQDTNKLSVGDQLAFEIHRPLELDEDDIVFHRSQAAVYRDLMDGKSVILSAPTSFGKSLIIDAVIAAKSMNNVVVIVPTISLIDETRRRLTKFSDRYKLITHPNQEQAERNIFVLTQERALDLELDGVIDFLVIDEFYKLDPQRGRDDIRSAVLNYVVYKLSKNARQFYMLGPNIRGVPPGFTDNFRCEFVHTTEATVVSEAHRVDPGENKLDALVELCRTLDDKTLIFCQSPGSSRKVAERLLEDLGVEIMPELEEAANWIGSEYHPDWVFAKSFARGIGIHHGQIARALAQHVVREFNSATSPMNFLVCTSTLIEGVNTAAKNVIIYDNQIARNKLDYFTFNNIAGRSGRMFKHFVGRVYHFEDPPKPDFGDIDIPMFSQDENSSDGLLVQLDEGDLNDFAVGRVEPYRTSGILSYETIRANKFIDPEAQISLAQELLENPDEYHRLMSWTQFPNYHELLKVCELFFSHLGVQTRASAKSAPQLAWRLQRLSQNNSIRDLIISEVENPQTREDASEVVEIVIDFLRYWASFHVPRLLQAVNLIQREVFARLGLTPGNYDTYAGQVENLFSDPAIIALDEYGIPIQLGRKLEDWLEPDGDLDAVLVRLAAIEPDNLDISPFERIMLRESIAHL
ncbi:MAG: DEAD/DEAH box helicase [Rhodospirillales bacterium]|nr:DEAD/DEAH box helicase [Rhodospirillales bacterium]